MNKNKFKRKLDNALKNGFISMRFVDSLFKEEKRSLFNNVKIEDLVSANFASFVKVAGEGNVDTLIDTLYEHETMRPFLESEDTIKYLLDTSSPSDFETVVFDSTLKEKAQEYIINNFDYVIANYPIKKITPIYERMNLNEEAKGKLDNYFNSKKEEFLRDILTSTLSIKGQVDEKQLDALVSLVTPLVNNALEKENCKITDTKVLRGGGFSNVLRIGDTIIKVGLPRKTFDVPNDERLLQPYLRRDLNEEYGINAVVEVSDRVDIDINLSEEEMYALYKDMRDRGIVYGDFKYGNIGRLIKDNIPRNNPKNGMHGNVVTTLKAGEYVMLDTDFIFKEGDSNIELTSDMSRKFESMYQKQKLNKGR